MSAARFLAAGALLCTAAACERVVSIDLPEDPKRLVVQGRIERVLGNVTGSQTIRLTTTNGYFSAAAPPAATGATVIVDDGTGTAITFTESAPGVYTTSALVGVVGRAYTLSIDYQGEHYESSDTLHAVAPIDSLYFAPPEQSFDSNEGLRATIDFQEPAGVKNWYLWEQFVNGERILGPDSLFRLPVVANDDGLDGRELVKFQPFNGMPLAPNDDVLVRQLSLTGSVYRYLDALGEQTTNDGSPFAVPPSSVRGNVRNTTNPSRYALGYFMATEVAEARGRP